MTGLRFGAVPDDALVVCVDMQRVFMEPGDWYCAGSNEILPVVKTLVAARPSQALFSRFIAAQTPDDAVGSWQRYYRRWHGVTIEKLGRAPFDLHPELAELADPANVFDKTTYDAFDAPAFAARVAARGPATLLVCGVETDVCVLATVLSAVDLGHRVILIEDALASCDAPSHDASLSLLASRFDQQVELARSAEIMQSWAPR